MITVPERPAMTVAGLAIHAQPMAAKSRYPQSGPRAGIYLPVRERRPAR